MPAWITSEWRELMPTPMPSPASTRITSRPLRAKALATASPITPAQTTRHSISTSTCLALLSSQKIRRYRDFRLWTYPASTGNSCRPPCILNYERSSFLLHAFRGHQHAPSDYHLFHDAVFTLWLGNGQSGRGRCCHLSRGFCFTVLDLQEPQTGDSRTG